MLFDSANSSCSSSLGDPKQIRDGRAAPFYSHRIRSERATSWSELLETGIERSSYLFQIRRQVRDLLLRGQEPEAISIEVDDYGSRQHGGHGLVKNLRGKATLSSTDPYRSRYRNFRVDFDHGAASQVVRFVKTNEQRGIKSALATIPTSPAGLLLLDSPERDLALYEKTVARVARAANVRVYDIHGELKLKNRDFSNVDHMGARGDRKVEDYLVRVIERELP